MKASINTAHVVLHRSEPVSIGLKQEPVLHANL